MAAVTMYTTRFCPYCMAARDLLNQKGVAFEEIPVDGDVAKRQEMTRLSGGTSVPQIWVGEQHIGGCDEMYALERQGKLDGLLQVAGA